METTHLTSLSSRRMLHHTAVAAAVLGCTAWLTCPPLTARALAAPSPGVPDGAGRFELGAPMTSQPRAGFVRTDFYDVAGTSSNAWLVGDAAEHHQRELTAIVEDYSGGQYKRIYIDKSKDSTLYSIRKVTDDDLWAAGSVGSHELIVHYDGSSWTPVTPTNPPPSGSLGGVGVVDSNDVWFVGNTGSHALAEHWIGTKVTRVKDPVIGSMTAVSGDAPDDVWAAGVRTAQGRRDVPVVQHWDGSQWTQDNSFIDPNHRHRGYGDWISSVVANAPDDVWVFGSYGADRSGAHSKLLIEHWDGTSWHVTQVSVPDRYDYEANSASALSPTDIYLGGAAFQQSGEGGMCPLLLHWDGTSWTTAKAPACSDDRIEGLTVLSDDQMWAAMEDSQFEFTFLEHWNGTHWRSP